VRVLIDNLDVLWRGFRLTLALLAVAGAASLVWGVVLATLRVSPVSSLRAFALTYVQLARNTPLTVLFALVVFGLPTIGLRFSFFTLACIALSVYTSAFHSEAIRSGINGVPAGQAEAARAIGMTFGQILRRIVLPQALRLSIPPLVNVFTALAKNTSIAAGFGLVEATGTLDNLLRDFPTGLYAIFAGVAAGYVVIVLAIAGVGRVLESRLAVAR
jgi:glutamate transport system permease protein